jgi:hypothetical protein
MVAAGGHRSLTGRRWIEMPLSWMLRELSYPQLTKKVRRALKTRYRAPRTTLADSHRLRTWLASEEAVSG